MRHQASLTLLVTLMISVATEAHGQRLTLTMKMWMDDTRRDQLLQVVGAMSAASVFMACQNQQQSVGVVLEALRTGYTTGVFKPDDSFGDAFFRTLRPYECVAYIDLIPLPTDRIRE